MTRLEARWKMPCREEGLAGAGRLGYAQSALLELSIGIAFTVVKAEPDNKVIGKGTTFENAVSTVSGIRNSMSRSGSGRPFAQSGRRRLRRQPPTWRRRRRRSFSEHSDFTPITSRRGLSAAAH